MKNYLIPGDYNALCDSCGRKFKASQLKRRWDGLMVCEEDYELRHPQDFLRVQRERISVPWARPYPETDTEINPPWICTIDNSRAFAGRAMAGCAVSGSITGVPLYITAVAGAAIAGLAISGNNTGF